MKPRGTPIDQLSSSDFAKHRVWEFLPESHSADETYVAPVRHLPVSTLERRVVAANLILKSGSHVFGFLGNVSLNSSKLNEHFLTVSVFAKTGEVFHLARYHDLDFDQRGPQQLADFLALSLRQVFPIAYDLSSVATGLPQCLRGKIGATPRSKLSRAKLIAMAVG